MTLPPRLQELSALLRHDDKALIDEGIALALALEDPKLLATLFKGTAIRASGAAYEATGIPEVTLPPALKPKQKYADQGVRYAFYALLARSTAPALVKLRAQVVGLNWGYTPYPIELERFTSLVSLSLSPQQAPPDLTPLRTLPQLKRLTLSGRFTSLAALRSETLEDLRLYGIHGELYAPDALPSLRWATFESVSGLTELSCLRGHSGLTLLRASNCKHLTSLAGVEALAELEHLDLGCSGITSLDALRGHPRLTRLNLSTTPVRDLSALASLPALRHVDLSGCAALTDVSPLAGLSALEVLDLRGCVGVRDVSSLAEHPTLRTLALHGTSVSQESLPSSLAAIAVWVADPPVARMALS